MRADADALGEVVLRVGLFAGRHEWVGNGCVRNNDKELTRCPEGNPFLGWTNYSPPSARPGSASAASTVGESASDETPSKAKAV